MCGQRHHHLPHTCVLDASQLPARAALVFGFRSERHEACGAAAAASCSYVRWCGAHDSIRRVAGADVLHAREERDESQQRSLGAADALQVQVADDTAALPPPAGDLQHALLHTRQHLHLSCCAAAHLFRVAQAWTSDTLKDDWEGVASTAVPASARTVRLSGCGGIVDAIVVSVLKGNLDPRPPCAASECCELNDDAALEVSACIVQLALRLFESLVPNGWLVRDVVRRPRV